MKKMTRTLSTVAVGVFAAGGLVFGATSAAVAAPECVGSGGISKTIGPNGEVVYGNDARCGDLYQYEYQYEVDSPYTPYTLDPVIVTGDPADVLPWGCAGVVGSVLCAHYDNPAHIEVSPGQYVPNPDFVEPEPVGTVDVGEPETISVGGGGGGGGGGYGGGGFIGGGSSGGTGTGNVSVGAPETVTEAE